MLQNSPEAMTSTAAVCIATDTILTLPTCRLALFLAFRQLSKKYLALLLWTTSKSVPLTTSKTMTTTYACMMMGGIDAESSENGLLLNIGRQIPHECSFRAAR